MTSFKGRRSAHVFLLPLLALALASVPRALGLGLEDLGNDPVPEGNYDEWKGTDIIPVINHSSRVYHTWVNGNEHFYYRGDATAANGALRKFAAVKLEAREVVIRPGPAVVSTWSEAKRVSYDWQLHLLTGICNHDVGVGGEFDAGERNPTMTIFVGAGRIELEKVQIPEGVTVLQVADLRKRYLDRLKSEDAEVRAQAVIGLAEVEPYNEENLPLYVESLDHRDTAWEAAYALQRMGKSARPALPALREALAQAVHDGNELLKGRFREIIEHIEHAEDTADAAIKHRATLERIAEFCKSRLQKPEPPSAYAP